MKIEKKDVEQKKRAKYQQDRKDTKRENLEYGQTLKLTKNHSKTH